MSTSADLLPGIRIRYPYDGPTIIFSTPPGPTAYGWCLACGASLEFTKAPGEKREGGGNGV